MVAPGTVGCTLSRDLVMLKSLVATTVDVSVAVLFAEFESVTATTSDQAAEIIHIGQAIMSQPAPVNSLNYFINTTFNYPTMAEAYRVAALNGFNRLT